MSVSEVYFSSYVADSGLIYIYIEKFILNIRLYYYQNYWPVDI
jgi:hypothetical protein